MKKSCLLLLLLLSTTAFANDLDELLEGVSAIDSQTGTVPGAIICTSPDAFPIVVGNGGGAKQAVIAGARYGRGRIVVASHPAFYAPGSLKLHDTERLVRNALDWLGGGQIGIFKYPDAEQGIARLDGLRVKTIANPADFSTCQIIATYPDKLSDSESEAVRQFVLDGGGVLACCIGWGWQQLNPAKTLVKDSPFNKLFGPAGLLTDNNTVSRTGKGFVVTKDLPPELNVSNALAFAQDFEEQLKQVNATLLAARAVLPPDSPLNQKFNNLLAKAGRGAPSVKNPWRAADLSKRLAAAMFTSGWQANPFGKYQMHPGARSYPGLPEKGYTLCEKTLSVDLSVPRWHGTGMFAVAGQPLTVRISRQQKGLRLRIGTTTCNNTRHDHWERMPLVTVEIPLNNETTTITSPFGGLVYIVVPNGLSGSLDVSIKDACAAVWFKVGRDKLEDWPQMLSACKAPQAEIEGSNVILTVPKSEVLALENPVELMTIWDKVADLDAELTCIPKIRPSAERYCADDQLCAGWMHSGYPLMVPTVTAKDLLDPEKLRTQGNWGFFHEIGHNHQNRDWTFDGTTEVTVNFFSLYVMEKLCGLSPRQTRMTEKQGMDLIARWKSNGQTYSEWKREPFLALEMFVRLLVAYGWEPYLKMFAEYRELPQDGHPRNDEQKRDQWVLRFSRLTGENIAAVFDAWHVPISDDARQACAKYPRPKDTRIFDGL